MRAQPAASHWIAGPYEDAAGPRLDVGYPATGETIAVWDVAAGAFRGRVAIPNYVTPDQVAFHDAATVVIPLADRLAAYDLDGNESASSPITSSEVSRLAAAPGEPSVLVTGWDGRLRQWVVGMESVVAGLKKIAESAV